MVDEALLDCTGQTTPQTVITADLSNPYPCRPRTRPPPRPLSLGTTLFMPTLYSKKRLDSAFPLPGTSTFTLLEPAACAAKLQTTLLDVELDTAHGASPIVITTSPYWDKESKPLPDKVNVSPPLPLDCDNELTTGVWDRV